MVMSYRDLIVWQKSISLVILVYRLTKLYPRDELYGLISQSRRAAVSIPANIAEGYARRSRKSYSQFVRIAFASGSELETLIVVAKNLRMADISFFVDVDSLLNEVMRMLNALERSLSS